MGLITSLTIRREVGMMRTAQWVHCFRFLW